MTKIENAFEIDTKEYKLGHLSYFNGEKCLSSIEYSIEGGILTLIVVETKQEERKKGYASLLLKELIKLFGETFVFELSCCPLHMQIGDEFLKKQEELSEFYKSFGFKTEFIETYNKHNRFWKMKRIRNT